MRDNLGKPGLIPHMVPTQVGIKALALWEEPAQYQLVGEVMAHQGYDA